MKTSNSQKTVIVEQRDTVIVINDNHGISTVIDYWISAEFLISREDA